MEKPHRMAQIYGYTVCLVAVITFIICVANIIPSIMDLSDPMHAQGFFFPAGTPSLASFDNYKMDILKSTKGDDQKTGANYVPDDKTLRSMYEAARADRISQANHSSIRTIVVCGLIILISVVLFITHWIWMKGLMKKIPAV
ncbi:MAG: hypothetical protein NTU98_07760 [Bacteroidetes bacterium]|nr:hypothetical protein [Bacteroidota bacterium]